VILGPHNDVDGGTMFQGCYGLFRNAQED